MYKYLVSWKRETLYLNNMQAIHAREMMPCQDTPSVKSTFSAKVWVQPMLTTGTTTHVHVSSCIYLAGLWVLVESIVVFI